MPRKVDLKSVQTCTYDAHFDCEIAGVVVWLWTALASARETGPSNEVLRNANSAQSQACSVSVTHGEVSFSRALNREQSCSLALQPLA